MCATHVLVPVLGLDCLDHLVDSLVEGDGAGVVGARELGSELVACHVHRQRGGGAERRLSQVRSFDRQLDGHADTSRQQQAILSQQGLYSHSAKGDRPTYDNL